MGLVSVSDKVPDRFIGERLARSLAAETGRSVLILRLESDDTRLTLRDWLALEPQANGELCFSTDIESLETRVGRLTFNVSNDETEGASVKALAAHLAKHFDYVLMQVGPEIPLPFVLRCLQSADRSFLLLQATAEDLYHRDLLLREIRNHPQHDRFNLKSVVCRENNEEQANPVLREIGPTVHAIIHGCPTREASHTLRKWDQKHFESDVRRLARDIGHCRVGLALSAGGARGLAHIGVLQVLEENGIEVDVVAGCSMGSYVGSVWAYGCDGATMEKLAREVEHRWGLFELIDPFLLPRQGFLRGEKVKRRLKRSIGETHFSELLRPLRVVATNLDTLERTVFSNGEVAAAVHASSAIPGACAPVAVGDGLYVDGGIADPLPVDVLEEMGIERIIAVNTIPTAAYLSCRHELERERAERHGKRVHKVRAWLNRYLNYFAPGNILDIILRSFHGAQMRVAEESCLHADLVLRPLAFDGRWHDFRHPGKYIAIGRRETEAHLSEIKALIARRDHEHATPQEILATIA